MRNQEVASAISIKQYVLPNSSKTYEFGLFLDMPIIKFRKSNIEYLRCVNVISNNLYLKILIIVKGNIFF